MKSRLLKRALGVMMSFVMAFGLTACGNSGQQATAPNGSETEDDVIEEPSLIGDATDIEAILDKMTLEDKVEQMMIICYRIWKEVPNADGSDVSSTVENTEEEIPAVNVTELNDEIRADLKEHHYGGTILFAENCKDAEQTLKLVADIQKTNSEGGGLPMIVATDQEGGNVARLGFGTTGVGNMALGATGNSDNARTMATIYGEELGLLGINTDFAPVMDINNNPNNPVIGVRSFSDSPEVVSTFGVAYMEGLHDAGTIATLKHFPGHGNTDTDSHTGFPRIDANLQELKERELIPFQRAIDAGADMIMTAHIQYPQIETETYTSISSGEEVYLPATMSRTILTDILRDDMGFQGVVVTDALDMAAITENFETEDILALTINAGADMLLLPCITDTELFDKVRDMTDTTVRLAEEGKIDTDRIDESVRRILTLKQKYGLLDQTDYTVTDEQKKAAVSGVGSKEHLDTALDIARSALTLVKNDNDALPVKMEEGQNTLILFADSCASRIGTGELVKQKLYENGMIPENSDITVMKNTDENEEECLEAAKEADYCILVYRTYNSACLDPATGDGFSSEVFDQIVSMRHEAGKQSVIVTCQLPYDAARFEDADAIMLSYTSATMREIPPESGEGSAYAPNLVAALLSCFEEEPVSGKLPVNIFKLDENYQITDEILYKREVSFATEAEEDRVVLGDEQFDEYIPLLSGKRVALFSNHTGIVGDQTSVSAKAGQKGSDLIQFGYDAEGKEITYGQHILDALIEHGVNVTAIFSPEHGFRGTEDAGANIDDSVDEKTGVPILSLYANEDTHSPASEDMDKFDILVVDMQDVGLRYYTYYLSMYYLMDACAAYDKEMIILDRPNPNGFYVDGPILKEEYKSNVGQLPIPVVYGMTWGELAGMINGEGWLNAGKDACTLTVIPCKNYTHSMKTSLIRKPSPNIRDMRAVYLYASTCFFENTYVSVGRGTDQPFEIYGSPYLSEEEYSDSFVPKSIDGASNPPFEGETCNGRNLQDIPIEEIWENGINLEYLIDAYNNFHELHPDMDFFDNSKPNGHYWIDLLSGSDDLRKQITAGKSAAEIKESWQDDIKAFREQRKPYLLYAE